MSVFSPIVSGSGVSIIHQQLQTAIADYILSEVSPYRALNPFSLKSIGNSDAEIIHGLPDLGASYVHPHQKAVFTFHNFYLDKEVIGFSSIGQRLYYKTLLQFLISRACQRATTITVVSDFLADVVNNFFAGRFNIEVIKNGVDCDQFKPIESARSDSKLRIFFAGNPTRRKGFDLISTLANELPDNVEIAFTSGLRDNQRQSNHPKLIDLGRIPHSKMHEEYQRSDILLFPTLREGFGLVVAEAMACGIPVVSTDCSAIPELIEHKKGGLLCPPGDKAAIRTGLFQLIKSPGQRKEMGEFNRERACNLFALDRMVKTYESLFTSL